MCTAEFDPGFLACDSQCTAAILQQELTQFHDADMRRFKVQLCLQQECERRNDEAQQSIAEYNPATGQQEPLCIARLQVSCDEFEAVNLQNVEPKDCFSHLGGKTKKRPSAGAVIDPLLPG